MAKNIHRTDHLYSSLNTGKKRSVVELVHYWRKSAPVLAAEQMRLFYETGSLNSFYSDPALNKKLGSSLICTGLRNQVTGMLASWLSNRARDFTKIVSQSNLSPEVRHQLNFINKRQAWFSRDILVYKPSLSKFPATPALSTESRYLLIKPAETLPPTQTVPLPPGQAEIPLATRRLARSIMREVFTRHTRPTYANISVIASSKMCEVQKSEASAEFPLWLNLSGLKKRSKILIPLKNNPQYFKREGEKRNTVQIIYKEGQLSFGLITEVSAQYAIQKEAYLAEAQAVVTRTAKNLDDQAKAVRRQPDKTIVQPGEAIVQPIRKGAKTKKDEKNQKKLPEPAPTKRPLRAEKVIALDFGLRTLFATSEGDLLGQDFMSLLAKYDLEMVKIAAEQQRKGLSVATKQYKEIARRAQAATINEVNRALNHLVLVHRPTHLVVERLNFQGSNLSKKMNRLLQKCGRTAIRKKLSDLHERMGIISTEVNPAYSSQECHKCGYIDKLNRSGEDFKCLNCGQKCQADINATRVLLPRRSWPDGGLFISKQSVLRERINIFTERYISKGLRSGPPDFIQQNSYFSAVRTKYNWMDDVNEEFTSADSSCTSEFRNHFWKSSLIGPNLPPLSSPASDFLKLPKLGGSQACPL